MQDLWSFQGRIGYEVKRYWMYQISRNVDFGVTPQERGGQLRPSEKDRNDKSFRYMVFGMSFLLNAYRRLSLSSRWLGKLLYPGHKPRVIALDKRQPAKALEIFSSTPSVRVPEDDTHPWSTASTRNKRNHSKIQRSFRRHERKYPD